MKTRLYTVKEVMALTGFSSRKVQRRAQKMGVKKGGNRAASDYLFTATQVKTIQLQAWHGINGGWYRGWA